MAIVWTLTYLRPTANQLIAQRVVHTHCSFDGLLIFSIAVRERKLERLRDASYTGTPEEWEHILTYALVSRKDSPLSSDLRQSLKIDCKIAGKGVKSKLVVTLQTEVEGIDSKHGSIELAYSADTEDVDLFGWTSQVATERDALQQELFEGKSHSQIAEETISSLQKQLKELVKAKEEHEKELLSKLTLLLNEKKLRIRSQQRQIAIQDGSTTGSKARRSTGRPRKRKQDDRPPSLDDELESEGFEEMEVDEKDVSGSDQESDQARRTQSEADNDSEASEVGQPPKTAYTKPRKIQDSPPKKPGAKIKRAHASPEPAKADVTMRNNDQDDDDDETASEDDEL